MLWYIHTAGMRLGMEPGSIGSKNITSRSEESLRHCVNVRLNQISENGKTHKLSKFQFSEFPTFSMFGSI